MENKREIALLKDRLRQALSIRNMKSIELAEKTGLSRSAISQYLSGYTAPKSDRIYKICQALNVSEAWLLGFDVPMEKPLPINFGTKSKGTLQELAQGEMLTRKKNCYITLIRFHLKKIKNGCYV